MCILWGFSEFIVVMELGGLTTTMTVAQKQETTSKKLQAANYWQQTTATKHTHVQ
jgi:hypothetical protein